MVSAMAAGAKSRARIWRTTAQTDLVGAALGVSLTIAGAGCSQPAVDVRAVWIGATRTQDGGRTLHSYAAGTITTSRLGASSVDPVVADLPVLVELDPRGRGALVRAVDDGWLHELGGAGGLRVGYVDLSSMRALPLWVPDALASASFTATGDALTWTEGCPQMLAVMPLTPGLPLTREQHGASSTLAPLRRALGPAQGACDGRMEVASAADAPVIFLLDARRDGDEVRVVEEAAIAALRYPAGADETMDLESLAQGRLPAGQIPLRLPALGCARSSCGAVAVDPAGEAVSVAVYGGDCRLLRFEVASGETVCAVTADAPAALQTERLVAAISGDHYVFREGLTVHRYDWRSGELSSRPLPGAVDEVFTRVTPDGRAVVVATYSGTALRVDATTIDLLSIERQPCTNPQPPVVSPSGRHLAWTCTLDASDVPFFLDNTPNVGDVLRVSTTGMERYQGVPMWALAIDDDGDLLLHSRRNRGFNYELELPPIAPRNLYVLAADGELARIDGLEPEPELMRGLATGSYRWIAAGPL